MAKESLISMLQSTVLNISNLLNGTVSSLTEGFLDPGGASLDLSFTPFMPFMPFMDRSPASLLEEFGLFACVTVA